MKEREREGGREGGREEGRKEGRKKERKKPLKHWSLDSLYFRTEQALPDSELAEYARFIRKALGRTRGRELVPSLAEISALSRRQELLCTVHCPGAGACPVSIDSHTTAGEVRRSKKVPTASTSETRLPALFVCLPTVLLVELRVSSTVYTLFSFSCPTLALFTPSLGFVSLESQQMVVTKTKGLSPVGSALSRTLSRVI
jgi:hypothetical protein